MLVPLAPPRRLALLPTVNPGSATAEKAVQIND